MTVVLEGPSALDVLTKVNGLVAHRTRYEEVLVHMSTFDRGAGVHKATLTFEHRPKPPTVA